MADFGSYAFGSMSSVLDAWSLAQFNIFNSSTEPTTLAPIIDLDGDGSLDVSLLSPVAGADAPTYRYTRRVNFSPSLEGSANGLDWLTLSPGIDYTEDHAVESSTGTETLVLAISRAHTVSWQFRLARQSQ